ncbi:TRAP transporter small permease [Variovorax paradoxus]|nr:TRAP transporter small permease [Variovorax paradoxus]MBT2301895.1 TRAP transporter small permease [Variovorax paradoxus]
MAARDHWQARLGLLADRALRSSAGLVGSLGLFAMMWLTLADILSRKFSDHSIRGATEITEILLVAVIFASLPLVSWRSEHVMLDALDNWLSKRGHAIRRRIVNLGCSAFFAFLAYLMVKRALRLLEDGDTTSHLQLPIAPVVLAMSALLALTALVHLLLLVAAPPPAPPDSEPAEVM